MRVIFYNPQMSPVVGTTLYKFSLGIFSYGKYWHLLRFKPSYQDSLCIFIDSNGTSLLPKWLGKILVPRIELFLWLLINHLNPLKVKVFTKPSQIHQDDILIGFSVYVLDSPSTDFKMLSAIKCVKIFHLTHFIQLTSLISTNAKKIGVDFFIAENNLYRNSPYFRKHFNWYKRDVYTLPFAFQDRFLPKTSFQMRKNKAMAIGTVVDITGTQDDEKFNNFTSFYQTTIIQPLRYEILRKKLKLAKYIDSHIGELFETKLKTKSTNTVERLTNVISNATKATKRKYFSFNMTDTFNEYRMIVNGEEINNLPGIGFVEGMACGCAYLGQDDRMYRDIGLIPDVHYITHNGSLEDLTRVITKFQKQPKKLSLFAKNGSCFVRQHFSGNIVAHTFFEDLFQFSISNESPKEKKLICSFTDEHLRKV